MKNIFLLLILLLRFTLLSQTKSDDLYMAIGFWNVENLYDTIDDKWKNDEEFTPDGANAWNSKRYFKKIERLSEVIGNMATDATPEGLAILGLCEIENKTVLKDLVASEKIKSRNYQFIHVEGPDARGVDVALLYNPLCFKVNHARSYGIKLVTDSTHKTRDILVVSGIFMGEPLTVLVNHWPSRLGGELKSRPNRNAAARQVRRITDSIFNLFPETRLVVMGDFNDDPTNESVKKIIGTYAGISGKKENCFYNPMEKLFKQGLGTLAYQDSWNLFDQILLSEHWLGDSLGVWKYKAARIYNKPYLRNDYGNFKGYPFRTYSGGTYTGGYSDHFPSYVIVEKRK